jgi:4-amino-4-deoxy-L-arabinose transferase-like glycosyltransferase
MRLSAAWLDSWRRYKYGIGLAVILAVAAFMRFHRLDSLPPGLHPDEAANGLDVVLRILNHDLQPFYPANGGREALFFYFQAIGVLIYGNTTYALRVAPATISTVAVAAMYLWTSSWFGKRIGLIAAAIMATAPWAIIIGRDGFRAGMVALMVPLILWLYTKAIQTQKLGWYIGAGFALGAGFYTYIAFRLFPVAIGVALVYAFIWRRKQLQRWGRGLLVSVVTMAIVLIPMGIYGIHHPDELFARTGGVSITNPALNHGHLIETFGSNIIKTAGMFNFQGDENYRQNLGGQPEFNIFVGIMFVLGLFICFTRLRKFRYVGVLVVFGTMLLPEVLTAEGIPHALRAIGALPPAVAMAAIGVSYLLDQWYGVFPRNAVARLCGSGAVLILLLLSGYQGYVEYFVAWANAPQTYAAYSEDTTAMAGYYLANPFQGQRYAVDGGYSLMPLQYLTYKHVSYIQVDPGNLAKLAVNRRIANEFITQEGDRDVVLKQLRLEFPNGRLSPHYSSFSGKELFVVYTVPAS